MRRIILFSCILLLTFSMTACRSSAGKEELKEERQEEQADIAGTAEIEDESQQSEKREGDTEMMLNIQVSDRLLTATLEQNSSVDALVEMLEEGSVTINMDDYANMEKVGALPESLPRNDRQTSTEAGDLILYQGNSFVIYYETNSWNFTRLGKINDITQQELKDILGDGSVSVVLSLSSE